MGFAWRQMLATLKTETYMPVRNAHRIAEMTAEEFRDALTRSTHSDEQIEALYPDLREIRTNMDNAVRDLQQRGILDENERLIPSGTVPIDMRPESETDC